MDFKIGIITNVFVISRYIIHDVPVRYSYRLWSDPLTRIAMVKW